MTDETIHLDEMAQRIGRALGEHMGPRFSITGNGAEIKIVDRWAESPTFVFTVGEEPPE